MNDKPHRLLALIDMDGTVADFDGAMRRDLARISSPNEHIPDIGPDDEDEAPWLKARKRLIKSVPGWWKNLPEHAPGLELCALLGNMGFDLQVLTKGPWSNSSAWAEKVEWCREHLPGVPVTITEDKGIMYGKVLVDDFPPYGIAWLNWRPRGLLIVPAWPWNRLSLYPESMHSNIFRYTGAPGEREVIVNRLKAIKAGTEGG